jgi:hypothetical protein
LKHVGGSNINSAYNNTHCVFVGGILLLYGKINIGYNWRDVVMAYCKIRAVVKVKIKLSVSVRGRHRGGIKV